MKKLIYLSLVGLLLGVAQQANAQMQLAVGLKGGLNFASIDLTKSASVNYDGRTGYHFGAYAMFKFTKLAIQPEVVFSKQGQQVTVNSQKYDENYDYVNIPIMIKFYLAGGFNLQAGPQFGFLSSAKGPLQTAGNVSSGQDLKNFVNSSDVSIGVGFGWDLPFGLNLGARYNIGLSDINKQTGSTSATSTTSLGTNEAKNQVIQISVGYRLFKIGS